MRQLILVGLLVSGLAKGTAEGCPRRILPNDLVAVQKVTARWAIENLTATWLREEAGKGMRNQLFSPIASVEAVRAIAFAEPPTEALEAIARSYLRIPTDQLADVWTGVEALQDEWTEPSVAPLITAHWTNIVPGTGVRAEISRGRLYYNFLPLGSGLGATWMGSSIPPMAQVALDEYVASTRPEDPAMVGQYFLAQSVWKQAAAAVPLEFTTAKGSTKKSRGLFMAEVLWHRGPDYDSVRLPLESGLGSAKGAIVLILPRVDLETFTSQERDVSNLFYDVAHSPAHRNVVFPHLSLRNSDPEPSTVYARFGTRVYQALTWTMEGATAPKTPVLLDESTLLFNRPFLAFYLDGQGAVVYAAAVKNPR